MNWFCSAYLDDVLIYSITVAEHKEHVRKVIEALGKAGLYINLDKCEFFRTEVKYLGLIISANGIRIDPAKLTAIKD